MDDRQFPFVGDDGSICKTCHPGLKMAGKVTPTLVVAHTPAAEAGSGWVLLSEPCHSDDELISFESKPTVDPSVVDPENHSTEQFDAWLGAAGAATSHLGGDLGLRSAWSLVNDLVEAGYDPQGVGDAELWLYDRVAEVVAASGL